MAYTPLDMFKENFQKATGIGYDTAKNGLERQQQVISKSHNNVRFNNIPASKQADNYAITLGKDFSDSLNDIIDFYQKEFKVTPRATIDSDMNVFLEQPYGVMGLTTVTPDKSGQYNVSLFNIGDGADVKNAQFTANEAERESWWPKNSSRDVGAVQVHELGHVLTSQLFKDDRGMEKLVKDSLKDLGIDYGSGYKERLKAIGKAKEISGYAANDPTGLSKTHLYSPETVAEALTDYYYNRENAADLSKAITKRIKMNGAMYGITQMGGVGGKDETFLQNLRRYSVTQ